MPLIEKYRCSLALVTAAARAGRTRHAICVAAGWPTGARGPFRTRARVSDLTCPNASALADGVGGARHEAIVAITPVCDLQAFADRSWA